MSTGPQPSRVLVVDDDAGVLRAVARVLGRRHQVTCAESGTAALDLAKRERPSLAIVDVRLPDMSGFEVTRLLKGALRDVDVILMTGNAEDPDEALVRAIDEGAFYFIQKPFDRRVLLTLAERCLELRQLRGERERFLRRVKHELEQARQFQLSLLPPSKFEMPGVSVAARYHACNELAGDFYDYVVSEDGALSVLIADVVGHGASAAMMTGLVKAAFRSAQAERFDPNAVIERVGDGLRDFDGSHFVTLCCLRLEPGERTLTYINAGHPPPLACKGRTGPLWLEPTGPLMSSAMRDFPFNSATVGLDPGDSILLYTDGIVEARGPGGQFGTERLAEIVLLGEHRGPDLLDRILSEVSSFAGPSPTQDDMTMVALDVL
jgi:sigma-B regulation protein RsbU (phosphoserine phosphatase)